MTTKPISEKYLDKLLDMAADAPDYNHEKLAAKITAQAAQSCREGEDTGGFLFITIMKHPFLTAGITFSIAALGLFTGLGAEILYGELQAAALLADTPVDFHTSLLLI
ncbi:MAG: hypothetical protein HND56_00915 [Pseudomonadota bacterium]|jgi:hypothetical protein|nr:hypothetical protein [Pseudomonadota bacterium]QKK04328.1 MAG: hypothetical protein HND56_00915 [Pseudomonadota bacterium]